MTTNTYSRQLVAKWSDSIKYGIYEGYWSVRLYEDRATLKMPYVRWLGNSGGPAVAVHRITGRDLDMLLQIAREEQKDDADYTSRVKEIIWDY